MSDHQSDDLAAEARERTRQQVRDIFTRAREVPERTCPHCGEHTQRRDADQAAPDPKRKARRTALVGRLEAVIAVDARARLQRHEIAASSIRAVHCHPLVNGAHGDELDLRKPLGRYACEAQVGSATSGGVTSTLGLPFVGTIDFARGRLTWCKDNPVSAGDVKDVLAFVRLARECTAARGPAFGSGYLIEPRR
jgi:hypothetical protein